MDIAKLIEQIANMLLRRAVRSGTDLAIRKGSEMLAGKGKPADEMTAEEQQQVRAAQEAAKRARKAAQLARRLGR